MHPDHHKENAFLQGISHNTLKITLRLLHNPDIFELDLLYHLFNHPLDREGFKHLVVSMVSREKREIILTSSGSYDVYVLKFKKMNNSA